MSVRQYVTQAFVESVTGVAGIDAKIIESAEVDIDMYYSSKKDVYNTNYFQWLVEPVEFPSSQLVFTESTITIINQSYSTNFWQYTVVEILEEASRGTRLAVTSSNNNVLNFEARAELAEYIGAVKIYQVGCFPRQIDYGSSGCKSIPYAVLEAVAWQATHLSQLGADAVTATTGNAKGKLKSESIGSTYSYTRSDKDKPEDFLSQQAQHCLSTLI